MTSLQQIRAQFGRERHLSRAAGFAPHDPRGIRSDIVATERQAFG